MIEIADKKVFTVDTLSIESPGVKSLHLVCNGEVDAHIPGQYLTVYLPELGTPEGKAYSISSAPWEKLCLTIREMGEFSNRLCALRPGDTLLASRPNGYFYSESESTTLVMLAAGIGITPFRSIILNAIKKTPTRPIKLFYSNRTTLDMVFGKALDTLSASHPLFEINYFITRETNLPTNMKPGRIKTDLVLDSLRSDPDAEVMICGSISFVQDYWRNLKKAGVNVEKIYTEAFF